MFDTISLSYPVAHGIFVAQLNSIGAYQWARGSAGYMNSAAVTELKIDEAGNCFAAGYFEDTLLLDNVFFVQPGPTASTHAGFLLEFTPFGQVIAGKRPMNAGTSDAFATAFDIRNCNIAFAGVFRDTPPAIYFDNDSLLSNGMHDLFVSRINTCLFTSFDNEPEIFIENFVVYPNPSKGTFTITLTNPVNEGIFTIYSAMGVKVFEARMNHTSKKEVYLKNISAGIYYIKVSDGEKYYCKKIIIEQD